VGAAAWRGRAVGCLGAASARWWDLLQCCEQGWGGHLTRHQPATNLAPPVQPWYELLEAHRHLLPEEEARERLAGESWPLRLGRAAERCVEQLAGESARLQDELLAAQEGFAAGLKEMQAVRLPLWRPAPPPSCPSAAAAS
jgi:hypothetical protein